MKWDYTTNPPKAWKVTDGDSDFVDQRDIKQCCFCQTWYVLEPLKIDSGMCSPGCILRKSEKIKLLHE